MAPISDEEYKLLRLLQNEPTITYADIARQLDVSAPTAKRKVQNLKNQKIYRGKAVQYEPETLGLNRFMFILFVNHVDALPILEQVLKAHPYTIHRSRIYGSRLGIVAQFNYPKKDSELLCTFFNELKQRNIIQSYLYFKSKGARRSLQMDLERISLSNLEWQFDWINCLAEFKKVKPKTFPITRPNVISSMKPIDFDILRILTSGKIPYSKIMGKDDEITQIKICKYLNKEPYEISRRMSFLEENILSGYSSRINREYFNVSSNKIILMSFKDDIELQRCFTFLSDNKRRPPFRYHLEVFSDKNEREQLLMYVSLPQYHEAQLIYSLSKIAQLRVFDIDTIGYNSTSYAFYEGNFDTQKFEWKFDKKYVVDAPLEKIVENVKTYSE